MTYDSSSVRKLRDAMFKERLEGTLGQDFFS